MDLKMPALKLSSKRLALYGAAAAVAALLASPAMAQRNDAYRPPGEVPYETQPGQGGQDRFGGQDYGGGQSADSAYGAPAYPPSQAATGGYGQNTYGQPQTYGQPAPPPYPSQPPYQSQNGGNGGYAANNGYNGYGGAPRDDTYRAPPRNDGYGAPYSSPPVYDQGPPPEQSYQSSDPNNPTRGYYSQGEIVDKGRGFFGSITQGLASAIEYTYQKAGRPNGYVLGEDGGGAFFAGLRYGEGTLYTKDAGDHKVFWQGPSLGYDVGGEGSKVMVLVYNLTSPNDMYERFGGVEGSAYLVGGVSVQFQKNNDVTLAVIRSGIGLRLGANVGYLKYTRRPTWNPF